MSEELLASLVGRTVTAAVYDDEEHQPVLTFDDGRRITFEPGVPAPAVVAVEGSGTQS